MPKKKQPLSLEEIALMGVKELVLTVGRSLIKPVVATTQVDPQRGMTILHANLTRLNEMLYASVPWYLFDKLLSAVLQSVNHLIVETRACSDPSLPMSQFVTEMNVVVSLTEIAIHPQLHSINFLSWPKVMRHVLYRNLSRMSGLEVLDLTSGTDNMRSSDIERSILTGVVQMKNLQCLCLCFDCTDNILAAVSENCPQLQSLDVMSSRSVTDRSVPALRMCTKLRQLELYLTLITVEGYAQLLMDLPALEDLGRCPEFGNILNRVRRLGSQGPFNLKTFQSRDVTTAHLQLLVEMCPNISHVSIFHEEHVSDLSVLAQIENLSVLKLQSCDFFSDNLKGLLDMKGTCITWLHLENVEEIDMDALVYVSQLCPMLKKLVLLECEFLEQTSISTKMLEVPPFARLEHLICSADCALTHLELLLFHCINVKFVELGSSTGIDDKTMAKILAVNPMKKLETLRILYGSDLSMKTVDILMAQCDNLRVLSELEGWEKISPAELADFRRKLIDQNIDLDVRPLLFCA